MAWDFNSSDFPGLLLWIPKTGELSNCRKYVSWWLGPLKFTPVKHGGVGYWMVNKPQISNVVNSSIMSFKRKAKIKVKEHFYCISLHGWLGHCMHARIVVHSGSVCQNLASLKCIFDFITYRVKPSMKLGLFTASDQFYQCSSLLSLLFSLHVIFTFVFHPAAKIIC